MKDKPLIFLGLLAMHLGIFAAVAQPVITNQPQNQSVIVGATATFSVGATGAPPLIYQGVFNSLANRLPGATNDTLIVSNVQSNNAGVYRVIITNDAGSIQSVSARLTLLTPPRVITQPSSLSTVAGESANLSVVADGTLPLAFQWSLNGQAVSGATNSGLVFASLQISNAGAYQILITNLYGAATSQVAELSVASTTTFTKVTTGSIVTEAGTAASCAWGDYDGDGFIDLIVSSALNSLHPTGARNLLFKNNGDGSFSKITNTPITLEARDWRGCYWADYDNDGNLDLFIASVDATGSRRE